MLSKGNVKTHIVDWLKGLKNPTTLDSYAKPTLLRPPPLIILPQEHNPNIIKAHIPDLTRSYQALPNGLKDVLENNRTWANTKSLREIKFFENLNDKGQEPKLFWIGCSDSRVVPETITQLGFGQIFVHRNIANQFNANDFNCMSELEFAVHNIKVEHIIVCGHTKCVGVMSACNDHLRPNLKAWLSDIRRVKDKHPELFPDHVTEANMSQSEKDKLHRKLVEINVSNQVSKIASHEVVQEAWRDKKRKLAIHGWIFNMKNGYLEDIGITIGR
ncbi:carbonic anhydrase [Glomus cerebriforme]|uniref:Carbonic anhydrase n=1 Tax=Glomus cerebriforme TaxID=658196 RepID=A0A397TAZ3_9GLOM|nr:carbonic anhydrase [Glomus cerebriforme]